MFGKIKHNEEKKTNDFFWVILCKVGEVNIFKYRLFISALEQARVVKLGKYVLVEVINTLYKHCYA